MARGRKHPDEVRAAVMAALLAGQGCNEVARTYHLDRSIVSRWRKKIPSEKLQQIATKHEEDFAEQLYSEVKAITKAFQVFARFLGTRPGIAWIKAGSPSEAATLYGVLYDKRFRILEAQSAAEEDLRGDSKPAIPV